MYVCVYIYIEDIFSVQRKSTGNFYESNYTQLLLEGVGTYDQILLLAGLMTLLITRATYTRPARETMDGS